MSWSAKVVYREIFSSFCSYLVFGLSTDEDIIPLDDVNRSRVNDLEAAASAGKYPEKSFRLCGVTRKTAIAVRIILFVFIVITMTSLLLLIHKNGGGEEEVVMQHGHKHQFNVITKRNWTMKTNADLNSTTTTMTKSNNKDSIPVRVYVNASSTPACRTHSECIQLLQTIEKQRSVFEVNFWISYDGTVFQDSGWTTSKRIFISFIADETTLPSTASLEALEFLLESGVRMGNLDKNYKIIANKSFLLLSKEIQKSPHWNSLEDWLSN